MDRVTCRESCKRHMAVSGKVRRGKRGFSAMANDIYVRVSAPYFNFCAASKFPNCSSPLLFLFLLFLQHILFSHFCGPKNRHIGAVFAFLGHSRSKKQRKYRYFLGLGSLKPRYLRYFLLLETNITVFTMFLCQFLAKHCYLHSFHNVARRCNFYRRKRQKHCILRCFAASRAQQKKKLILASFLAGPDPQKRENPTSLKDFGGSAAGAHRCVAKAMLQGSARHGEAPPDI